MDSHLQRKGCTWPRPRGDVRTQMETPPHSKPLKAKTFSLVTLLLCLPLVEGNASPHQVHRITWRVFNTETGNTVKETTGIGPIATYFPTLTVDLCDIVGESWDPSPQEPFPGYGCQHPGWRVKTRGHDFYVCPGHSRGRSEVQKCGGPAERYCKAWGCETTRSLSFKIKTNDKEEGGNVGLPNCLVYFD